MIDIITWLITLPTNPLGFLLLISVIIYLAHRIMESIAKDEDAAELNKMIISYIKDRKSSYALGVISRRKAIERMFKRMNAKMKGALEKTRHIKVRFSHKLKTN